MSTRTVASSLVVASLLAFAPDAQAAAPARPEGKLRLHVDTEAFGWTQVRRFYEPDEMPVAGNPRTNYIGFGALRALNGDNASSQAALLLQPLIGLGLGYGVHRNVIIGVRAGFNLARARDRNDASEDNNIQVTRAFGGVLLPYIEILPIPEGRILPFIVFRGGFSGAVIGQRSYGEVLGVPYDELSRLAVLAPQVGLGAGAHFFVTPGFSLDLSGNFDYRWIFGRDRDLGPGSDPPGPYGRVSQSFTLALGFGLSAWF